MQVELKQDLAMVRSENQHMYDALTETMRDIQTELLKAFYNFGVSNSKRMLEVEG